MDETERFLKPVPAGDPVVEVLKNAMAKLTPVPDAVPGADELRARQATIARLRGRGLPERAVEIIVDGKVRDTAEYAAHRRTQLFMAGTPGLLVLAGGKGCGKTTAGAIAASKQPTEPYAGASSGRWPTHLYPQFRYAATIARMSKYEEEAKVAEWTPLLEAWLLVIDDLGMEFVDKKGNFTSMLDEILAVRHGNRLRTIITANLTLEEFSERYGDRLLDRVKEDGVFYEVAGDSMRGRNAP
jgi:DNA replication protein DnaC